MQNTVLHSRNIVVVIYTSFLYFLMQKYIDFYHRRLVPTKMVSAKTVSVLVNFSYSSVHWNLPEIVTNSEDYFLPSSALQYGIAQ